MRRFFLCLAVLSLTACDARDCAVKQSPSDSYRGYSEHSAMRIEKHFSGQLRKLAEAAACGDAERVAELIEKKKLDPNTLSEEGMPLLLWPVHQGNLDGFVALLENGADPNLRASNSEIALHYVVEPDGKFVRSALQNRAESNRRQNRRTTAAITDLAWRTSTSRICQHNTTQTTQATNHRLGRQKVSRQENES